MFQDERKGTIKSKAGNVYFLEIIDPSNNYDLSPFYKIGITKDAVPDRINGLQTGNPFKILKHQSFSSSAMEIVEKYLHNLYSSHRVRREWFNFGQKKLQEALAEAQRFNNEINVLMDKVKEFDAEPSNGKEIEGDSEVLNLHRQWKELSGEKRKLEAKKEISIINLDLLTGNTLGIADITKVSLRQTHPYFNKITLKRDYPEIYAKYLRVEEKIIEPNMREEEFFTAQFKIFGKPSIKQFTEIHDHLNQVKDKQKKYNVKKIQEKILDKTDAAKKLHETYLGTRQKIATIDGRIETLGLKIRNHCKNNEKIKGICDYKRTLEIIKPDIGAKSKIRKIKRINHDEIRISEPKIFKKCFVEKPPIRVFEVIKFRDYIQA